jgi:hypothetical protein
LSFALLELEIILLSRFSRKDSVDGSVVRNISTTRLSGSLGRDKHVQVDLSVEELRKPCFAYRKPVLSIVFEGVLQFRDT